MTEDHAYLEEIRVLNLELEKLRTERDDAIKLNQLYYRTRQDHRNFAKNAQEQRDEWMRESQLNADRLKWLNWYVQKGMEIQIAKQLGNRSCGDVELLVVEGFEISTISFGSSIEDCIDGVAQLHPMP
jgi:hypothetical protein